MYLKKSKTSVHKLFLVLCILGSGINIHAVETTKQYEDAIKKEQDAIKKVFGLPLCNWPEIGKIIEEMISNDSEIINTAKLKKMDDVIKLLNNPSKFSDDARQVVLQHAVRQGHLGVVECFLDFWGKRRMSEDERRMSKENVVQLLIDAAYYGQNDIVQRLLALNGDHQLTLVDVDNALTWAAQGGKEGVVERLMEWRRDNENIQDIHNVVKQAAYQGQYNAVRHLLGLHGDNAHVRQALLGAATGGHEYIVDDLLSHYNQNLDQEDVAAALRGAAENGRLGVVKSLLDVQGDRRMEGVDVMIAFRAAAAHQNYIDYYHPSAFYIPADHQHYRTPTELSKDGMRYNDHRYGTGQGQSIYQSNYGAGQGQFLYKAVFHKTKDRILKDYFLAKHHREITQHHPADVVQYLLDLRDNRGLKRDDVRGALQHAAQNGNLEIVNCLLNINDGRRLDNDDVGMALTGAAENGRLEIVNYLLNIHDGRRLDNDHVGYALTGAAENGRLEIVNHLLNINDGRRPISFYARSLARAAERGHDPVVTALRDGICNEYRNPEVIEGLNDDPIIASLAFNGQLNSDILGRILAACSSDEQILRIFSTGFDNPDARLFNQAFINVSQMMQEDGQGDVANGLKTYLLYSTLDPQYVMDLVASRQDGAEDPALLTYILNLFVDDRGGISAEAARQLVVDLTDSSSKALLQMHQSDGNFSRIPKYGHSGGVVREIAKYIPSFSADIGNKRAIASNELAARVWCRLYGGQNNDQNQ
jgi:ankyrin repeat protein